MNNHPDPFISIIIPAFNVESYIEDCLNSLLNQSCTDFEVILIDDGSSDRTASISKACTFGNERFVILTQVNSGQSVARNRGLAIAKGKFVYFLDADDKVSLDFVSRAKAELSLSEADIWGFNAEVFVDETAMIMEKGNYERKLSDTGVSANPLQELLRSGQFKASVCLHVFNRAFLEHIGLKFLPGVRHEDEAFTLQATLLAKNTLFSQTVLFFRRLRPDSVMTSESSFVNVAGYFYVFVELSSWSKRGLLSEDLQTLLDKRILIIYLWSLRGALRLKMLPAFRGLATRQIPLLIRNIPLRYALAPFCPLKIAKVLAR